MYRGRKEIIKMKKMVARTRSYVNIDVGQNLMSIQRAMNFLVYSYKASRLGG